MITFRRPTRAERWAALASLGLALFTIAPVLLGPSGWALGRIDADLPAHLWSLWWASGPPSLANFPVGGVDFYVLEPINLLVQRLSGATLGLLGAHHLGAGLAVATAAMGGFVLGRTVHPDRSSKQGGLAGLLLVGVCQPLHEALADGVGEFTWVGLLALGLAAFLQLARRPGLNRAALASLAAVLTAWSCWYHGLMLGLAALLLALPRGRRALGWTVLALAAALLLLLPIIHGFAGSDLEPLRAGIVDTPGTRFPLAELLPLVGRHQPTRDGWKLAILGLAVVALVQKPGRSGLALLAVGGLGFALSMGSATSGGCPLPFRGLNAVLLLVGRPIHVPARFMIMGWLGLIGLACRVRWRASPLLVLGLLVIEALSPRAAWWPLPSSQIPAPRPLIALREQAAGAVISFPSVLSDAQWALDQEALQQLAHHHPIPRFPLFPTNELADQGLRLARDSALVRAVGDSRSASLAPPSVGDLAEQGYSWVIVDQDWAKAPTLDVWLGPPLDVGDGVAVYAIDPGSGH